MAPVARIAAAWRAYWLAPGGRWSAAMVRIAIAASVLWTLHRLGAGGYASEGEVAPESLYRAIGPWLLWPDGAPSAGLIEGLRVVAWAATVAMLVGLGTRISTAISLVSALAVASFDASFTPTWSHHDNVPFLAQIAFLGARGGDVLSLDAVLRRWRGLPPADAICGYQWSVRLVQLAAALMFLSAACFKLAAGGAGLRWALSDNLRHQLLARFDMISVERSPAGDWLLGASWRYQGAALLNLLSQLAPIGAVLSVRRPWLRAGFGAFFVLEVVGLGVVMDLWNTHWLPLAAAFVDWDRLVTWAARRPRPAPIAGECPPGQGRAALVFVTAFVVYDVVVSFVPSLDQRLRTYPFSSFPMFARVRARAPYDQHLSYELIGGRIAVIGDQPLAPAEQAWIDRRHPYRLMWRTRSADDARRRLAVVLDETRRQFPGRGIRAARLYLTTYQVAPYPAPARLVPHDLGLIAELGDGGRLRTALGVSSVDGRRTWIEPRPAGVDVRDARLLVFADDQPTPLAIDAERDGERFSIATPPGASLYYVAEVPGEDPGATRWLVAQGGTRRW